MFRLKARNSVLLFFLVYIATAVLNGGFMGTDEYWTGITRYIPAQEKNLQNMMLADDVKSPTQLMPLMGLSHLALQAGFLAPYEQYRFVQIFVGIFSTLLLGFCLLYFVPQEKHLIVFLSFTFYFAGAFAFTRPMFESMSAPWILLSALSLNSYFKQRHLRWVLYSVLAHPVGSHLHGELREKIAQNAYVTVDALDHFARSARVVEAHVQPQAVQSQVGAQAISCLPRHHRAAVNRQGRYRLSGQDHTQKNQRCANQVLRFSTLRNLVDITPQHLRPACLESNAPQQQASHHGCSLPLWFQIMD